jgi:hypothetical protein
MLDYCPETGIFTRKASQLRPDLIGKEAGSLHSEGYRHIKIKGMSYYAHRLAWFYYYGVEPTNFLDHINGVKGDNRIKNLRGATNQENCRNRGKFLNNAASYKGVSWCKLTKKYHAQCQVDGKKHHLGRYPTPEEAHAAYVAFATEHHGEFARVA